MKVKEKIEDLNKQFQELGIDYTFDTREEIVTYVLINEVGSDVGDEVYGVYDNRKEAEEVGGRLYSWRIEEHYMRKCIK